MLFGLLLLPSGEFLHVGVLRSCVNFYFLERVRVAAYIAWRL